MNKLNLTINVIEDEKIVVESEAKSVCGMWVILKKLFKEHPTSNIVVKNGNEVFKDLVFETKSSGKFWMVNRVKSVRKKTKNEDKTSESSETNFKISDSDDNDEKDAIITAED